MSSPFLPQSQQTGFGTPFGDLTTVLVGGGGGEREAKQSTSPNLPSVVADKIRIIKKKSDHAELSLSLSLPPPLSLSLSPFTSMAFEKLGRNV